MKVGLMSSLLARCRMGYFTVKELLARDISKCASRKINLSESSGRDVYYHKNSGVFFPYCYNYWY